MREIISLTLHLAALAEREPGRSALTCDGTTLSRAQLVRTAAQRARTFQSLGVGRNDLVAIALPNGIKFVQSVIACWQLGATPLPMSARLAPAEFEAILRLANPQLVVGIDSSAIVPCPWLPASHVDKEAAGALPLAERIAASWKAILSGGSTGRPKIIVDTRPGLAGPHVMNPTMRENDVVLVPGPMYHNAGFKHCMNGLMAGAHVIVLPRFDVAELVRLVRKHRVSWLSMVPTMMHRLLRFHETCDPPLDMSGLRIVYHGGAPCPIWLKQAFIEWFGPDKVFEIYGGAENNGLTFISGAESLVKKGSVGRPMPGYRVQILDEALRPVPAGAVGSIFMRPDAGPGTTYRYLGAEPNRQVDGFESLGDIGYLDEDGYLFISDRLTDLILRGGANVYPAEIEAAIDSHPSVGSSAVVGLPDDDLGQRVHAIVNSTRPLTEGELLEFLGSRLARYKLPASIEFVSKPLRDEAGKVRRTALRDARMNMEQCVGESNG
jgi:bile acid-coenzyme A ligase